MLKSPVSKCDRTTSPKTPKNATQEVPQGHEGVPTIKTTIVSIKDKSISKVKRNGIQSYKLSWELDSIGMQFNFDLSIY